MAHGRSDVEPTVPPFVGGLVTAKARFNVRAEDVGLVRANVPTQASGKLQRAEVVGDTRIGDLRNPDQKVGGRAKDVQEQVLVVSGRVDPLPEEARDEPSVAIVGLIRNAVYAGRAAGRGEDKGHEPIPIRPSREVSGQASAT